MADAEVIDIAPEGDVIFVVGIDKKKLRVNSTNLSAASRVFGALLGPHFREGSQQRSSTNPVKITLPDDDATAMIRICDCLHPQPCGRTLLGASEEKLLDFAIVADKYDLSDALHHSSRSLLLGWCAQNENCSDLPKLGNIIAAASLLKEKLSFKMATERVIRHCGAPVSTLSTQPCGPLIPFSALVAMAERRRDTELTIFRLPTLGKDHGSHCNHKHEFLQNVMATFDTTTWPPQLINVHNAIVRLESMRDLRRIEVTCEYGCWPIHVEPHQFQSLAAEAKKLSEGLCLDCVNEGADVLKACSKSHDEL